MWGSRPALWRAMAVALLAVIGLVVAAACSSGTSQSALEPKRTGTVGSLAQADALGNTIIGGGDRAELAFRFRATWTGSVTGVRFYVMKDGDGAEGYSSGDGGTMRVTLQSDAGRRHVPSGHALARASFRPDDDGFWPLTRFEKPASVVKGRLYHVVFTNTDSNPRENYASINALWSASHLGRAPAVPDDMAVLSGHSGSVDSWRLRRSRPSEYYLPIMDVMGAGSGQHLGLGYMEVWNAKPISGDRAVRQLLRAGSRTVKVEGAWLRVRRHSGDAPLRLSIQKPNGDTLVSADVPAGDVPTSAPGWVHVRFDKTASLKPGAQAALTASSSSGGYEAFPIRKGNQFGFSGRLVFSGGYAQFTEGDGWVGWDQWGGHNQRNSDLQFALDIAG